MFKYFASPRNPKPSKSPPYVPRLPAGELWACFWSLLRADTPGNLQASSTPKLPDPLGLGLSTPRAAPSGWELRSEARRPAGSFPGHRDPRLPPADPRGTATPGSSPPPGRRLLGRAGSGAQRETPGRCPWPHRAPPPPPGTLPAGDGGRLPAPLRPRSRREKFPDVSAGGRPGDPACLPGRLLPGSPCLWPGG